MYSTVIVLSLLAGSVLSAPSAHGHGHVHERQFNGRPVHEVIDIVDVYTTVYMDGPAPSPKPAAQPAPAVEEKMAEPQHEHWHQPPAAPVSHYQPPPPPASSAPPPPPPPPPASSAPPPPPPATSAAPPPTQSSTAPSSSGNGYLDLHNQYRNNHGAMEMTWDTTLASQAEKEVNGCPNNDVQAGSNWYGSSGSASIQDGVNAWYGEMSTYASQTDNYASNPPANPPAGAPETGHFSQMIWNSSISLGCAMASNCGGSWVSQVICLYEPAGNMVFNGVPMYTKNVFPPK